MCYMIVSGFAFEWWSLLLFPSITWLSVMIAGISLPLSFLSIDTPSIFYKSVELPLFYVDVIFDPFTANLVNSLLRPLSFFGFTVDLDLFVSTVKFVLIDCYETDFGIGSSGNIILYCGSVIFEILFANNIFLYRKYNFNLNVSKQWTKL